jgi:general secretion pathway protein F
MKVAYRAYDRSGAIVTGEIEVPGVPDALSRLQEKGLTVFEARPDAAQNSESIWTRDISLPGNRLAERANFVKLLATLLSAGIPLDRALRLLADDNGSKAIAKMAHAGVEGVTAGRALSATLGSSKLGFAADEIGLIRASEQTASLPQTLAEIASVMERKLATRAQLASALVYPALLVVMAIGSVVVIATVLVPTIAPLFEQSNAAPPAIVTVMSAMGKFVREVGWWLPVFLALAAGLLFILSRQPAVRHVMERVQLRSSISRANQLSGLCRTLGTLLRNGVALQSALKLTAETTSFEITRSEIEAATEKVVAGSRLSKALAGISLFDKQTLQMVAVGEETNKVDNILLHVAASSEAAATRKMERLMTLLTPLLTVGMGLFVGGLIMSVMRAILSLNDLALQ